MGSSRKSSVFLFAVSHLFTVRQHNGLPFCLCLIICILIFSSFFFTSLILLEKIPHVVYLSGYFLILSNDKVKEITYRINSCCCFTSLGFFVVMVVKSSSLGTFYVVVSIFGGMGCHSC